MKRYHTETETIRTQIPRTPFQEHSAPLYLTSSFVFEDAEDMRASFAEEKDRNIYSRYSNPNSDELIRKVCLMEGAEDGFAFASGMAAVFSTFAALLDKLQPEARTYLLDKMVATIGDPESTFSLQLRVILQYYYEKNQQLLSAADRRLITDLIDRYGSVDLSSYTATDFARWKADGRLSSLSIFQDDDDDRRDDDDDE